VIAKFTASVGAGDKQQATDCTKIITSSVGSYEIVSNITLFFERRTFRVGEVEECEVSYGY
jgi:hypothetical protein